MRPGRSNRLDGQDWESQNVEWLARWQGDCCYNGRTWRKECVLWLAIFTESSRNTQCERYGLGCGGAARELRPLVLGLRPLKRDASHDLGASSLGKCLVTTNAHRHVMMPCSGVGTAQGCPGVGADRFVCDAMHLLCSDACHGGVRLTSRQSLQCGWDCGRVSGGPGSLKMLQRFGPHDGQLADKHMYPSLVEFPTSRTLLGNMTPSMRNKGRQNRE